MPISIFAKFGNFMDAHKTSISGVFILAKAGYLAEPSKFVLILPILDICITSNFGSFMDDTCNTIFGENLVNRKEVDEFNCDLHCCDLMSSLFCVS